MYEVKSVECHLEANEDMAMVLKVAGAIPHSIEYNKVMDVFPNRNSMIYMEIRIVYSILDHLKTSDLHKNHKSVLEITDMVDR